MRPIFRREVLPERSRYNYKITAFQGVNAQKDLTSASLNTANYCFNITIEDGKLLNGPGINTPEVVLEDGTARVIPSLTPYVVGIRKLHLYKRYSQSGARDDRIIALGTDRYVYQARVSQGDFERLAVPRADSSGVSFCNYYFNGRDVLLIVSAAGGMNVYDGESCESYPGTPALKSVCMHYERLFGSDAVNPCRLHFSKDLDPTNWEVSADGAGYIDFMDDGGAIVKVISFKDYIYIFRENSIVRLAAYANPRDYSVSKVFSTSEYIAENSIVTQNGTVFFMAGNFLYSFDGYTATRMLSGVTALVENTVAATACCFKDKLYIAARLKTDNDIAGGDETSAATVLPYNNGFISIDLMTGGVSVFRGASIRGFFPLVSDSISELMVYFGNHRMGYLGKITNSGNLFGIPLNKVWKSPVSNLGSLDKVKTLRRVYVSSRYGIDIETAVDGQRKTLRARGSDKPDMLPVSLVGESASLKISTQNDKMCVSSVTFEFDTIRRYNAD
ncbi:MAG TPA: hypothetical protein PLS05_02205 [Clostridia bacterium]|nr:hypothetical protein [Clostridia bacterium]HPO53255.1 hypothetical protein [Clostridia bacterium]